MAPNTRPLRTCGGFYCIEKGYLKIMSDTQADVINQAAYLYVGAQTGAGKTYHSIGEIKRYLEGGGNVLYAAPTHVLLDQFHEDLVGAFISNVVRIDSSDDDNDDASGKRRLRIREAVELEMAEVGCGLSGTGKVLLITHDALFSLENVDYQKQYHLIVDEAPKAFISTSISLGKGADMLDAELYLRMLDRSNSQDVKAIYGHKETFKKSATGSRDCSELTRSKEFRQLARHVLSDVMEVEVLNPNATTSLNFISYRSSKALQGYKSVTIMSANFEDTFLYLLWKGQGIAFKEVCLKGFDKSPKGHLHHSGSVQIYYMFDRNFTLGSHVSNPRVMGEVLRCVQDLFNGLGRGGHDGYVYALNDRVVVPDFLKGSKMPVVSYGLNKWIGYDCVFYGAATNLDNTAVASLGQRGVNREQINIALKGQNAYQSVTRVSVRERGSHGDNRDMHLVVTDKQIADYLGSLFHDSRVTKIGDFDELEGGESGRPSNKYNDADYRRAKSVISRNQKGVGPLPGQITWAESKGYNEGTAIVLANLVRQYFDDKEAAASEWGPVLS